MRMRLGDQIIVIITVVTIVIVTIVLASVVVCRCVQGSRRLTYILLSSSGPQVSGVLTHRSSLQN